MTYSDLLGANSDLVLAAIEQEIAHASLRLTRLQKAKGILTGAVEPMRPITTATVSITNGPADAPTKPTMSEIRRKSWVTRRANLASVEKAEKGKGLLRTTHPATNLAKGKARG